VSDSPDEAIAESPESAGATGKNPVPMTGWAFAVLGLVLATAWVWQAPALFEYVHASSQQTATAIGYGLLFVPLYVLALLFAFLSKTKAWRAGTLPSRWFAASLVAGVAGIGCAALFAWLNGGLVDGTGGKPVAGMLVAGLVLIAFQVGAEELLFRGWLQALLSRLAGDWPAMLLGSLAFAAIHLANGPMALLSFTNLCLAGLLFALLAWRSGGIVAPFAAHLGWNAFEDVGLGLSPNPGLGVFGALHNFDIAGPALWGGSDEGLNASVGTMIVLLALILPLALGRLRAA
jgi:uncharacterized protein